MRHPRVTVLVLAALILGSGGNAWAAGEATWPHTTVRDGATVEVFQPQAISWPDRGTLTARAALAITLPGTQAGAGATPLVGTVEVAFATRTDAAARMVTLSDPRLVASRFPALDTDQAARLEARIKAVLPDVAQKQVPLASILASLPDAAAKPVSLRNDPPDLLHATRPASLVVFDGDPVMVPVGTTGLTYAANTNWPVFSGQAVQGRWFLVNGSTWFEAAEATGPYAPTDALPPALSRLPDDAAFAAARRSLPPKQVDPARAPTIFVATKPAELIVTDGPPKLTGVAGTGLMQVTNTNATLLLDTSGGRFYYLTSGRWFASVGLDGPWTFATPDLPPDFSLIPPQSQAGAVLASVPGTAQAQQALIEAQIPHEATLRRDAPKPHVTYAGKPAFQDIPGIGVAYATNTGFEVLSVEGRYYVCYEGAWFVGTSPDGPWTMADSVPRAIYAIPPSVPVYNVTYVEAYAATPEAVTFGATAGYMLGFATAGVLAYGTGYYYPPVVLPGPVPAYFPYPPTYAGGIYYNAAAGAWARGGVVYGPYGGVARGGTYVNPSTGAWARGGAVYGPNGGAGAWSSYNPTTGTYRHGSAEWGPGGGSAYGGFANARTGVTGTTQQHANAYGRWGSSQVTGPARTVDTASASDARGSAAGFHSSTGAEGAAVHGRDGNNAAVAKGLNGDVYAGHDGNVYRHSDTGWSKWSDGGWNQAQKPHTDGSYGTRPRTGGTLDSWAGLEQDRGARHFGESDGGGWMRGGGEGRRFR